MGLNTKQGVLTSDTEFKRVGEARTKVVQAGTRVTCQRHPHDPGVFVLFVDRMNWYHKVDAIKYPNVIKENTK